MIWELDDDQDGCLDWHEFRSCYARALVDKRGLEPNMLFHVIMFLLCDPTHSASVSGGCVAGAIAMDSGHFR